MFNMDEDAVDLEEEEEEDNDDYIPAYHRPVPIQQQQHARGRGGGHAHLRPVKRAIPMPVEYPTTGPVTTVAHFLEGQITAAEATNAQFAIVTHAAIDGAVGDPGPMEAFQHALRSVGARRNMLVTEGAPGTLVMDWRQEDQDLMRAPDTVGEPDDRRH